MTENFSVITQSITKIFEEAFDSVVKVNILKQGAL